MHGLGSACSPSHLEHLAQALDVSFGLHEVLFESLLELRVIGGLGHFRQGAGELAFSVKKILQLFDEQFFKL